MGWGLNPDENNKNKHVFMGRPLGGGGTYREGGGFGVLINWSTNTIIIPLI